MIAPMGIGEFAIGVSPIGENFDWRQTLYSQYANSPIIMQLLDYFSQAVDANSAIDSWYDQLWNIETAEGYGLDVWGRIIGIGRVISVQETPYFSFANSGGNQVPSAWYTWYSGEVLNSNYSLSDAERDLAHTVPRPSGIRDRRPRYDDDVHFRFSAIASAGRNRHEYKRLAAPMRCVRNIRSNLRR